MISCVELHLSPVPSALSPRTHFLHLACSPYCPKAHNSTPCLTALPCRVSPPKLSAEPSFRSLVDFGLSVLAARSSRSTFSARVSDSRSVYNHPMLLTERHTHAHSLSLRSSSLRLHHYHTKCSSLIVVTRSTRNDVNSMRLLAHSTLFVPTQTLSFVS